jgi:hypothetical protein
VDQGPHNGPCRHKIDQNRNKKHNEHAERQLAPSSLIAHWLLTSHQNGGRFRLEKIPGIHNDLRIVIKHKTS